MINIHCKSFTLQIDTFCVCWKTQKSRYRFMKKIQDIEQKKKQTKYTHFLQTYSANCYLLDCSWKKVLIHSDRIVGGAVAKHKH